MDRAVIWGLIAAIVGIGWITRNQAMSDVIAATAHKNVKAFLAMIRKYESANQYDIIYGGRAFDNFSSHPNIRIPFIDPRTGRANYSTAAGAYQITYPTWLTIQAVAALPDFSPRSQDIAAVMLLKLRGALGYILAGDFDNALRIASATWASLPGSISGQPQASLLSARLSYLNNGGQLA